MIRAFIVDLDGTLIDSSERISARVHHAVTQTAEKLYVAIATGREPSDAIRFARQRGLDAPQISDGGATIIDPSTGRSLWRDPLDPADAESIVRHLHAMQAHFIVTHPGGSAPKFDDVPHWNLTRVSALDLEEHVSEELVADFDQQGGMQAVKVFLPYNNLWAVDFTRKGVDKARATLRLASMLGLEAKQLAGAGDSCNDLPLLQVCGLGIAMGDAPPELKAMADFVAPTAQEDGLAVAIEEFLLPML